jgi:hypothetical protein
MGLGIVGPPDNEITPTTFIQLDLHNLFAMSPSPTMLTLTIQSIQTGEGFAIYQSNTAGVLGTPIPGGTGTNPPKGVTQTITVPISAANPFVNVTAISGDVVLSSVVVPQCPISAPLILFVPDPTLPGSIMGSFVGQLAYFQVDATLRTWDPNNPTIPSANGWHPQ